MGVTMSDNRTGLLPAAKTAVRLGLQHLALLLYGPSKVGKSTWCSQIPDALFIATEPGLAALEVFQVPVPTDVADMQGDPPSNGQIKALSYRLLVSVIHRTESFSVYAVWHEKNPIPPSRKELFPIVVLREDEVGAEDRDRRQCQA